MAEKDLLEANILRKRSYSEMFLFCLVYFGFYILLLEEILHDLGCM